MSLHRARVMHILFLAAGLFIAADLLRSPPIDPFQAPPPLAWGSGEEADASGFCSAPIP